MAAFVPSPAGTVRGAKGWTLSWAELLLANLVSTATLLAIAGFLGRTIFINALDARLEYIKHRLQLEATERQLTIQSQIQYKERQLSELYGPIYAMVSRGRRIVKLAGEGRLDSILDQFWEMARATNRRIEEILLSKSHLIEGVMPESFIQFLVHVPLWDAFMNTPQKLPPPKEIFPEAYYSESFEVEVYATTERLRSELRDLYARSGLKQT
jgi:hypothetical protein